MGATPDKDFAVKMLRLTPVLVVDAIEPVLEFWVDKLGFTKTAEVPHEDKLGFVILEKDAVQVMYQTAASVAADVPPLAKVPQRGTSLFIEVKDLDAIIKKLKGIEPVVPRRKTFYGADEFIVREPAGNIVNFAEMDQK